MSAAVMSGPATTTRGRCERFTMEGNERCRGSITAAPLAILAVQQRTHCFPPSRANFAQRFSFISVHAALSFRTGCVVGAAVRAAVGEAGLVGLQLELFAADSTDFDRESHLLFM